MTRHELPHSDPKEARFYGEGSLMNLAQWIDAAWGQHADDAAGVAARLHGQALPLLQAEPGDDNVTALARLAHHVHGPHLAQWQAGQRLLETLAAGTASAATQALLARLRASLALAAGEPGARAALPAAERVAVAALAADNLAAHDGARAAALLRTAAAEAGALALPDDAPAIRAIAVAANNAAGTLRDLHPRSAQQTTFMLESAAVARTFWGRAGTWLQVERAEYYLAQSHLSAGDAALAREHALACLHIVAHNGNVPLEVFFGQEALALAAHAAGRGAERDAAVAAATATFPLLAEADQGWCRPTLDKLGALPRPQP
jgi:hypothetical protein